MKIVKKIYCSQKKYLQGRIHSPT